MKAASTQSLKFLNSLSLGLIYALPISAEIPTMIVF